MKAAHILLIPVVVSTLLQAQEPTVIKAVKDRAQRGTLSDQRQFVRGDTGKWSDAATLQHVPPIARKPQGLSLDEWSEQLAEKKTATTATDDNWLIFRSRQFDDNDRMWIEKIERRGNEFTVTMHEAIWQGNYFKTFTYYEVSAVNFGKLPPGDYSVRWIVKPLVFKQLEKPREAMKDYQTNWPLDAQPGNAKTVELKTAFSVR
ncbi:MAG: hypothetical protein K9N47_21785 [Prosthecobacter sp.]|uniref:hypothetical protein n=1 Tax=Prosthecobacter sp. TaxID=1965333 RepID=UPI0026185F2D|nr:hypothetical protein [Prosthecobacter sp.]MCF7788771.1 hypothetical protein [Prosthecobacter sp.]